MQKKIYYCSIILMIMINPSSAQNKANRKIQKENGFVLTYN